MSATNKTQHYDLSQFIGSDIPGWLSDYNGDMRKIDTAINNIASAEASGEATVAELSGRVTTAENGVSANASAITALNNTVSGISSELTTTEGTVAQNTTNITGLTTRVGALETAQSNTSTKVSALETAMGDTDISSVGDGTVTGAISTLAQGGIGKTYSTDEVDTGDIWVDGKHIFEKSYAATPSSALSADTIIDAAVNQAYVDAVVGMSGSVKVRLTGSSADHIYGIQNRDGDGNGAMVSVETGGVQIGVKDASVKQYAITIRYTKATVTP